MPYFKPLLGLCLFAVACNNSQTISTDQNVPSEEVTEVISKDDAQGIQKKSFSSKSLGSVSEGRLVNGKSVPFEGPNFRYFDSLSFVNERCYLNDRVLSVVLHAYEDLERKAPNRQFTIMECSNKDGGVIQPHRTHQNGLSIDFMVPLQKDNLPCYDYDAIGGRHYLLDFNNNGQLVSDTDVQIDFDLIAKHLLTLDSIGKTKNVQIKKVILKTEFKKQLFNTSSGNVLRSAGIYFVQKLTPLINELHDDHYHIDFEII